MSIKQRMYKKMRTVVHIVDPIPCIINPKMHPNCACVNVNQIILAIPTWVADLDVSLIQTVLLN